MVSLRFWEVTHSELEFEPSSVSPRATLWRSFAHTHTAPFLPPIPQYYTHNNEYDLDIVLRALCALGRNKYSIQ